MKENTLFKKRLKTNISILLIPAVASILICISLFIFLQNSIAISQKITSDSVTTAVEQSLTRIYNGVHWIALQENFRTIVEMGTVDDKSFKDLQNKLINVKSSCDYIDKICVLFEDFAVTDVSYRELDRFYLDDFFSYGIGENVIKDNFEENPIFQLQFHPDKPASAGYISIRYGYIEANVLLYINNAKFKSFIRNIIQYSNGGMFVEDADGAVLFAGDKATEQNWLNSSGKVKVFLESEGYQQKTGKDTGLNYYLYIPPVNYGNFYNVIRMALIASIVFSAGISALLMILNVKKSVQPIIRLKEKMEKYADSDQEYEDDLETIDKNLDKLIEANRDFKTQIERSKYLLANNILIRFLRNLPLGDTLENICAEYGLKLYGKKINVLAVDSRNIREHLQTLTPQESLQIQTAISLDRQRLAALTFSEFEKYYVVDAEQYSYLILLSNPIDEDDAILAKIKKCAKEYQLRAKNDYTIYVSFSISSTVNSPDEIYIAYRQAEEVRSFSLLLGSDNEIIAYNKIRPKKTSSDRNLIPYRELRDLIRDKNFDAAKEKFSKIIENDSKSLEPEEMRCRMYSLIDNLILELNDATVYFDNDFLERLNYREKLLKVPSLEALLGITCEIFSMLSDYASQSVNTNTEWVEGVKNFINQNFADINLNVGFLADRFNFTLPYFSRAFKKVTGKGVFDYIQEKRIENAKELLLKNMPVGEVATKVGYLDSRTFIRTFKKYEGDTPSRFKRQRMMNT